MLRYRVVLRRDTGTYDGRRLDAWRHGAQARWPRQRQSPKRGVRLKREGLRERNNIGGTGIKEKKARVLDEAWLGGGGAVLSERLDAHIRGRHWRRRTRERGTKPPHAGALAGGPHSSRHRRGARQARKQRSRMRSCVRCSQTKTNSRKSSSPPRSEPLPAFSGFADAAMRAIRGLWDEINRDEREAGASRWRSSAGSAALKVEFERLRETARGAWLRCSGPKRASRTSVPVTQLAEAMRRGRRSCSEQMRVLSRHHHEMVAGGRRWFREESGVSWCPLMADTGIAASDYRIRLRALCLLAAQCECRENGCRAKP